MCKCLCFQEAKFGPAQFSTGPGGHARNGYFSRTNFPTGLKLREHLIDYRFNDSRHYIHHHANCFNLYVLPTCQSVVNDYAEPSSVFIKCADIHFSLGCICSVRCTTFCMPGKANKIFVRCLFGLKYWSALK